MIEEPYRWVEAIANRREYIETQLAAGSPIAAVSYDDGICSLRLGAPVRKFLRFTTESPWVRSDTRAISSACAWPRSSWPVARDLLARPPDVSLRRLAHYSLSPVMKAAFEQVYGPPYLARLLFAEIGSRPEEDLFLRVEYDGANRHEWLEYIRSSSKLRGSQRDPAVDRINGVLSGDRRTKYGFIRKRDERCGQHLVCRAI